MSRPETMVSRSTWARLCFAVLNIVEDAQIAAGRWAGASSEDVEAVRAMGGGDDDSARRIYDRFADPVFRYIYRRIGERAQDAEDLTLETFLSAIDLANRFDGRSGVYAWLCGIARVRLIDFHRKESAAKRASVHQHISLSDERLAEILHDGNQAHRWLDRMNAIEVLDTALKKLSVEEIEVTTLRLVEGHSSRDTAQLTGRSERAVESLLLRARAKLRKELVSLVGSSEVAR